MTFDDDLERAFRTLADRLHDAVGRELTASAAAIAASARVRPDLAPKPVSGSPSAALRDHILAIDAAATLTAILDALVHAATAPGGRAVLFLARRSYRAWRLAGFASILEADRTELPPERAGIVAEAVRRRATVRTTDSTGLPSFAGRTASAMAVPLLLGGEAVAVLYADSGGGPSPADRDEAAIEIMCSHAARAMEAHVAFLAARHVLNERTSRHISREAQAS